MVKRAFPVLIGLLVVLGLIPVHVSAATPTPAPSATPTTASSTQPYDQKSTKTPVAAPLLATVTRQGYPKPLDAALVPDLEQGDTITVDFSAWTKPGAPNHFFANYATIGGGGIEWWSPDAANPAAHYGINLFGPNDSAPPKKTITVTYDGVSTPVFFVIVDDRHTHGIDGVRNDVNASPQDFVNDAIYASTVADKRSWIDDFISGLGSGVIPGATGASSLTKALAGVGVTNQTQIGNCLKMAGTSNQATCIESLVSNNNNLPAVTGSNLGSMLAAYAGPASPYIAGLSVIWNLIVKTRGVKQHYEFLPGTIAYRRPDAGSDEGSVQVVQVPQVPQFAPPDGGQSDVIFFTVGRLPAQTSDPSGDRPSIVSDADKSNNALCAVPDANNNINVPLHLDKSSNYVHDVSYVVAAADQTPSLHAISLPYNVTTAQPEQASSIAVKPNLDDYDVTVQAKYGFKPMITPTLRLSLPRGHSGFKVSSQSGIFPNAATVVTVHSPAMACAKTLVVQGKSYPITLVDRENGTATITVANVTSGNIPATVVENGGTQVASSVPVMRQPPTVSAVAYHAGDRAMLLQGSGLAQAAKVSIGGIAGAIFQKDANHSSDSAACYITKSAPSTTTQSSYTALLDYGAQNPVMTAFTAQAPRPVVNSVAPQDQPGDFGFPSGFAGSSSTLKVLITLADTLPAKYSVRLRQLPSGSGIQPSACAALLQSAAASTIGSTPAGSNQLVSRFKPVDALQGGNAAGSIQLQVLDTETNLASDWSTLKLAFVLTPTIDTIACHGSDSQCEMQGVGLDLIDSVGDGTGTFTAVNSDCALPAGQVAGLQCRLVPRYSNYEIKLLASGQVVRLLSKSLVKQLP